MGMESFLLRISINSEGYSTELRFRKTNYIGWWCSNLQCNIMICKLILVDPGLKFINMTPLGNDSRKVQQSDSSKHHPPPPPCLRFAEHGSSTTWLQTSRYCRAEVEFNSINWVRHGSSTTFETGLKLLRWHWSCRYSPLDQPLRHLRLLTPLEISLFSKTTLVSGQVAGNGSSSWQEPTLSRSWDPFSSP